MVPNCQRGKGGKLGGEEGKKVSTNSFGGGGREKKHLLPSAARVKG